MLRGFKQLKIDAIAVAAEKTRPVLFRGVFGHTDNEEVDLRAFRGLNLMLPVLIL